MYSDDDIDSAVAAGAITAEAAAALRLHVETLRRTPNVDEEHFRLVSGFNDVFVVIASSLLLVAMAWIGASIRPWLGGVAVAAAAWTLSEAFVRRRRMALTAIALLLAFVAAALFIGPALLREDSAALPMGAALGGLAAWLHWRGFRVPITVAAGCAALAIFAIASLQALVPASRQWLSVALFVSGMVVFWYALRWDACDVQRQTRRSDVAFWLHLLAAPLIVHPVFTALDTFGSGIDAMRADLVLVLYVAIAVLSLWIDRRALMVSALGYVLYALTMVLDTAVRGNIAFAVTALIVATALLLLSAFWQRSRAIVMPLLPSGRRGNVPPLR